MLFSATYDDDVMKFAETIVPNALSLRLRREELSLDNIKQYYISCASSDDKFSALSNIYGSISIGQSMIFCRVSSRVVLFLVAALRDLSSCNVCLLCAVYSDLIIHDFERPVLTRICIACKLENILAFDKHYTVLSRRQTYISIVFSSFN